MRSFTPIQSFTAWLATAFMMSLPVVHASEAFWPEAKFSSDIPTVVQVLGHEHGEKISSPPELEQYLKALADAAPERTRLVKYAESWEGRPLSYLAVGSRETIRRLDAIQ